MMFRVSFSLVIFGSCFTSILAQDIQLTDQEKQDQFRVLFNGKDLQGWKQSGNWRVADGAIERTGKGGSLTLTSEKTPDDFELRFSWKVAKGSNSGIYYRPGQYEYQILDNPNHSNGKNPRQSAASLYFCMQPSADETKPIGQWNTGRIVCQGSVIQHWLNGKKVIDFDYTDEKWSHNVELLKKRGANLSDRKGTISLQDHGDPVWYKDLRIRTLTEPDDIGHSDVKPAEIPANILEQEAKYLDKIIQKRNNANK